MYLAHVPLRAMRDVVLGKATPNIGVDRTLGSVASVTVSSVFVVAYASARHNTTK